MFCRLHHIPFVSRIVVYQGQGCRKGHVTLLWRWHDLSWGPAGSNWNQTNTDTATKLYSLLDIYIQCNPNFMTPTRATFSFRTVFLTWYFSLYNTIRPLYNVNSDTDSKFTDCFLDFHPKSFKIRVVQKYSALYIRNRRALICLDTVIWRL